MPEQAVVTFPADVRHIINYPVISHFHRQDAGIEAKNMQVLIERHPDFARTDVPPGQAAREPVSFPSASQYEMCVPSHNNRKRELPVIRSNLP